MTERIFDLNFGVLLKPREILKRELSFADSRLAAKRFLVWGFIVGLVLSILAVFVDELPMVPEGTSGLEVAGAVLMALLFISIFFSVAMFLYFGFTSGMDKLFSKLFKSNGTYAQNVYLQSVVDIPTMIILILMSIIASVVPVIAWIIMILLVIMLFYSFYLSILASAVANRIKVWQAFIARMILLVILFGLLIVLIPILVFAIFSSIGFGV
ncbi:MAG: YIP1 family protein [Candidatus Diapherotrites archaeon]|nr:YIP1 family protein [Candidatus Diapherotrites archaeon]MDZ4256433.1 YIP1 family protein [archaeon]